MIAPVDRIPSSDLLDEVLDHGSFDIDLFPPSLLEDMAQSKASLDRLSKLEGVIYGGGAFLDLNSSHLSTPMHNALTPI